MADSQTVSIDIISDNICPFCYLGKKKVEAAVAKLPKDVKVEYRWHAFQLDPSLPSPGVDKQERYRNKFGDRIGPMLQNMSQNGKQWGIDFDFGGKIGNTVNSHRLMAFSQQPSQGGGAHTDALVNVLFTGYFEQQADLSSEEFLVASARKAGLPATEEELRTFLRGDELRNEVEREVEYAQQTGIGGVPHFTIKGPKGAVAVSGAQEPDTFLAVFRKAGVKTE